MDLDRPLDLSRDRRHLDESGTPTGLIELARRRGDLAVLDALPDAEVLVEYPLGPIWRGETGCERFVQLRTPRDGKRYALVRPASPRARGRRAARAESIPLLPYDETDPVGARLGLRGAGIMAYMTGDHMHPPMVDDEQIWVDAARWREGAVAHTRAAARLLNPQPGAWVLDVGCGVGGPARLLVDELGVRVYGVANSDAMIATARAINGRSARWRNAIEVELHDCQNPYARGPFDAAWSMNMAYVVPDQEAMLRNVAQALRPGGRLMIEDWMLTGRASEADRAALARHFVAGHYAEVEPFAELLARCGFRIVAREDLGQIGRTLLAAHHHRVFDASIRPRLEADFPAAPHSGEPSGRQMADEWIAAIGETIRLYQEEKLTYLRLVAALPEPGQRAGGVRL